MNICLVMPRSTFLIDPLVCPPLGLWYIAAQLEAQGHHTDFRDMNICSFPHDGEYDQVWISATSAQMHEVRAIAGIASRWKKTATVVGGAAAWVRPESFDGLGLDVVAAGECDHPEETRILVETAKEARKNGTSIKHVAGQPSTLDHLLPPVRRWSDMYCSSLEGRDGGAHRATTMFTSRGCPMACAFCESGRNGIIWNDTVRLESVELVAEQLKNIAELGYTGIQFYDDIFPINKTRTRAIMEELVRRQFAWRCFLRTDIIEKQGGFEYLKEMRDAGLVEVLIGVESADNRIKQNIFKGTTVEQDTQALMWCKELGIRFKASFVLGLPGETRDSMEATREWILGNRPDRVDVNTLIPFPGTPIMRNPEKYDVHWTEELPEEFWFKGLPDRATSIVGTSALTPDEVKEFRNRLVEDIRAAGIPY